MKNVPQHIAQIVPYPPGKPLEELEREYGITKAVKLASNENPLGPSPKAVKAIEEAIGRVNRYPDGSGFYLRRRIAEKLGVPFDGVVLGNGSNELIEMVFKAFMQGGDEVVVPQPSFLMYEIAAQVLGARAVPVPLKDFRLDLEAMSRAMGAKTKVVVVNNPNNPTGTVVTKSEWETFLDALPQETVVIADEAYIEFVRDKRSFDGVRYILREGPYVVSIRTFSKAYGLAGLRIGYALARPEVVDVLNRVRQPFNVNMLAQVGALAALDDEDFLERTRTLTSEGLRYLYDQLGAMGLRTIPTEANFFLVELPAGARMIYSALLERGVITRAMDTYGLERFLRVSVGLPEENRLFVEALREVLGRATFPCST